MTFDSDLEAFILSPVAIDTDYQKKGIGQKLILFGIDYLKQKQIALLFTYGDPNYYKKVGFQQVSETVIKAPLKLTYPEGWLAQSLVKDVIEPIEGPSTCVNALNHQHYW